MVTKLTPKLEKYYTFEQMITNIKADRQRNIRKVVTYSNHIKTFKLEDGFSAIDIPMKRVDINWIPEWGAFYYMT